VISSSTIEWLSCGLTAFTSFADDVALTGFTFLAVVMALK
jgi:hypothetical protein